MLVYCTVPGLPECQNNGTDPKMKHIWATILGSLEAQVDAHPSSNFLFAVSHRFIVQGPFWPKPRAWIAVQGFP